MALPRCNRCHRALKDSESISCGLGPTCRRKLYGQKEKSSRNQISKGKCPAAPLKRGDPNTITLDDWMARLNGGEGEDDAQSLQKEKEPTATAVSPLEALLL